jgi:hypothetical protein
MPINKCASPTFNNVINTCDDKDGWKWQREIGGKQSATFLQMDVVPVHYAGKQELNCYIHIKRQRIRILKFVKIVAINKNRLRIPRNSS